MKKFICILMILLMTLPLVACSAGNKMENIVNGGAMDMAPEYGDSLSGGYYEDNKGQSGSASKDPTSNEEGVTGEYLERKIVYTVTMELQTKNFDAAIQLINDNIATTKAYIQSQKQTNSSDYNSNYSRRNLTMVIRVPSENLDTFMAGMQNENIHTTNISKDSKDYSTSYYDKQIRIDNLKIQEERLLDMLSKATDLQTLLQLESRLSEIRYEIEALTKEMNIIDSNVNYSTVTIYMSEVAQYKEITEEPETFLERVGEAFVETWDDFVDGIQNFTIWLIHAIPTLIITGAIAFTVIMTMHKKKKKKTVSSNTATDNAEQKSEK